MTTVRRPTRSVLAAGVFLLGVVNLVQAQGIYLPTAGTVNRSMGGTSTAAPVDAIGSLYWNPATISGLSQSEIGFGMDLLFSDLDVSSSVPGLAGHTESDGGPFPIPAMGWVQKMPDPNMTIGLGMYAVAGFAANYPADPSNPILAPQSNTPMVPGGFGRIMSEAQFLQMAPVVSYQVSEDLAIGGGPTVTMGKLQVDPFAFGPPDDADGMPPGTGQPRYPIGTGSRYHMGLGAQLGLYYTGLQDLTIGASIKSPQFMEQFRFQTQDELGRPRFLKWDMDLPMIISAGAAWHGIEDAVVAVDLRYYDYRNTDGLGNSGYNADGSLRGLSWRNIFSVGIGSRWRMNEMMTVGAGYQYNPSPLQDADSTFATAAPLMQQHIVFTGATLHFTDAVSLHTAYTWIADADVTGPIITAAGPVMGSQVKNELSAHLISMGVSVKY